MEEMAAPSTDLERVERWLGAGAIKHTLDPATPNTVDLARFIACACTSGARRVTPPPRAAMGSSEATGRLTPRARQACTG